ncbi:MAG: glycosyltransferase [Planctomycetes bacterium]|nr:glycosyltransferase [Planctomycetota bacterium]
MAKRIAEGKLPEASEVLCTSEGQVRRIIFARPQGDPGISVVIPSLDGWRDGNVPQLIGQIREQTLDDVEVLLVIGVSPNGRARNVGVRQARGEYLVCIDDDVTLGHERVLENLVQPFQERDDVGMTGASQQIPPDSNGFQKSIVQQVPRTTFPVQDELVDSDMVTHMCLCMPTQLYKDVGWENEEIVSGTDPDLRYRVREAGYRVVVVPETWAYHPVPETPRDFWRQCYRKGRDSARVQREHPDLVLELDAGYREEFPARRSLLYRAARFALTVGKASLTGKVVLAMARIAYACGYVQGKCTK